MAIVEISFTSALSEKQCMRVFLDLVFYRWFQLGFITKYLYLKATLKINRQPWPYIILRPFVVSEDQKKCEETAEIIWIEDGSPAYILRPLQGHGWNFCNSMDSVLFTSSWASSSQRNSSVPLSIDQNEAPNSNISLFFCVLQASTKWGSQPTLVFVIQV